MTTILKSDLTILTKEKKLSLLVLVLLEISFSNNNIMFNKIIDYLVKNNILDENIISDDYYDTREIILNMLNSNLLEDTITEPILAQENNIITTTSNKTYPKFFNELELLGEGSFALVYKAQHKIDNNLYAIKKIFITDDLVDFDVFKEVKLFASLSHPNIVRYYSSWIDIDLSSILKFNAELDCEEDKLDKIYPILFIQMELCDYTLSEYILTKMHDESFETRISKWLEILYGIQYLHSKKIIHRDIKPSNIFFLNNQIKIADFGLSKQILNITSNNTASNNFLNNSVDVGCGYYRAPEIDSGNYNYKIDIYSLGIILIELLLNCKTFYEKNIIVNRIILNKSLNNLITDKYNDLILNMINEDTELRYTIDQVINKIL